LSLELFQLFRELVSLRREFIGLTLPVVCLLTQIDRSALTACLVPPRAEQFHFEVRVPRKRATIPR
jgi:hypothetical protein